MQALSSSALGSSVEAQAASDPVEGKTDDMEEQKRVAMERINASQRHRMGVLPGCTRTCDHFLRVLRLYVWFCCVPL